MEVISGTGDLVQPSDADRSRRPRLLDQLITVVVDRTHASVTGTTDDDVTLAECSGLNDQPRQRTTPFVSEGLEA